MKMCPLSEEFIRSQQLFLSNGNLFASSQPSTVILFTSGADPDPAPDPAFSASYLHDGNKMFFCLLLSETTVHLRHIFER
jgi:hypothetical protein